MSNLGVVVNPETTIKTLIELMDQQNIGAILIADETEKDTIIGIVTRSDLRNVNDNCLTADGLMSTQLYCVNIDDSIPEAAKIMLNNQVKHVLVKDNDKVVGILSATDLLRWIANQSSTDQDVLFFV
ncbi:MAG: CBS domain-containing protein [Haliscomenobacter sp.]|uniref:CBS domain-containing protein n=1 Tax=Haliscomenobacter sp. TaxID=2717303 RepID=UPI0029A43DD4|nr:CBS domain-containing protein [Haliscomenobacter sp.]MDX2071145.1 CBS domain-containing protein [Haliscomenobacter sp.]